MQDDAGGVDDRAEFWLIVPMKAFGHTGGDGFDADLAVKRLALSDSVAAGSQLLANSFGDAFVGDGAGNRFQCGALQNIVDGRQSSERVGGHGRYCSRKLLAMTDALTQIKPFIIFLPPTPGAVAMSPCRPAAPHYPNRSRACFAPTKLLSSVSFVSCLPVPCKPGIRN